MVPGRSPRLHGVPRQKDVLEVTLYLTLKRATNSAATTTTIRHRCPTRQRVILSGSQSVVSAAKSPAPATMTAASSHPTRHRRCVTYLSGTFFRRRGVECELLRSSLYNFYPRRRKHPLFTMTLPQKRRRVTRASTRLRRRHRWLAQADFFSVLYIAVTNTLSSYLCSPSSSPSTTTVIDGANTRPVSRAVITRDLVLLSLAGDRNSNQL